jgi:N-methylhydantoinase B
MNAHNETVEVDPIRVAVIGSRLDAISKEIGQTMLRTSRSPIFSEARDFVTGVFDHRLRLLAQTAYIPVLMGALPFALQGIVREYAGDIDEGDVFILNDPYRGNNHPPDITIAKPVFADGEVQFWAVSKGHHADVGGGGVVGYNPAARTVWEECVRIPPAKLLVRGKRNKSLWDFILLNVRMPWLVEADLECQIGACTIGERSLRSLIRKYGLPVLRNAADHILDASERQARAALREIPNGTYSAERFIDHDGIEKSRRIGVRLALTVADESVHFDWSASDPQVAGYVNSTLANTVSASFHALFMTVCSEVKYNEGALRALSVDAPAGSVLNAREPAPVTCCTVATAQTIIEAVWLALAQAAPGRVYAGWGRWLAPATMGFNPTDAATLR